MKNKSIVFTGGGSAGHVTPNIALMDLLPDWDKAYIGSEGIERELIAKTNVPFYRISSGKLRRYFSWRNFIDPFKVLYAICQSFFLLGKLKPDVVFSKGGFVAFPVVVAAWLRKIPVVAHESDLTPGLANRLSFPFCRKICITFSQAKKYFSNQDKILVTGSPIRQSIFEGNAEKARNALNFKSELPCVLVIAGGQGSKSINHVIRENLSSLLAHYQIIHICGKNNADDTIQEPGYIQLEYAHENLADLYALADVVISRAGANAIYELLALAKPHILIPLSKAASRGDQILNANFFAKLELSTVIDEADLDLDKLTVELSKLSKNKDQVRSRLLEHSVPDANRAIHNLLESYV